MTAIHVQPTAFWIRAYAPGTSFEANDPHLWAVHATRMPDGELLIEGAMAAPGVEIVHAIEAAMAPYGFHTAVFERADPVRGLRTRRHRTPPGQHTTPEKPATTPLAALQTTEQPQADPNPLQVR